MKKQAGKTRPLVLLFLVVAVLVCLFNLQVVDAQRKTQRKPRAAQPKPSPKPRTALEEIGAPPPVPTLKKQPEQEVSPGDVVSVDTTEVMFPVTVRDGSGRLISDLTRNDFRVFEDNKLQPLSDLALRQVPVDVILMVDASSSVASNFDDFRRAARGFPLERRRRRRGGDRSPAHLECHGRTVRR